jgi:CBS domain containing-hemolysin-like protein
MRGFMWATRPLLHALNDTANWCLRRVGVEPVDEVAAGQDPQALRQLVEHSANVGALDASYSARLAGALDLEVLTLGDLVPPAPPVAVPAGARVTDVQAASRRTGHLRILVGDSRRVDGVVHVRDTLDADPDADITRLVRPVLRLTADTKVHAALARMRETSNQLAVVTDPTDASSTSGLVTVADLLRRLFPLRAQQS